MIGQWQFFSGQMQVSLRIGWRKFLHALKKLPARNFEARRLSGRAVRAPGTSSTPSATRTGTLMRPATSTHGTYPTPNATSLSPWASLFSEPTPRWCATPTFGGGATGRARDTPLARISHRIASELLVHVASESAISNTVILILK